VLAGKVASITAALLVVVPASAAAAPNRGQYIGATAQGRVATLHVARRTVSKVVLEVDCDIGHGSVTLRKARLRSTARGFEFASSRPRRVTYDDGHGPETGRVLISGAFDRAGRKVRGVVRVKSLHCGARREVRWHATYTARPVKAPASAPYTGTTKQGLGLGLSVAGQSIELASIEFKCGDATGRTVLNDIELRLTRRGYAFDLPAHGGASYSDDRPDENVAVELSGRFATNGKSARGRLRVKSPSCGSSGPVAWTVRRRRGN
jgi:hypothetical protein